MGTVHLVSQGAEHRPHYFAISPSLASGCPCQLLKALRVSLHFPCCSHHSLGSWLPLPRAAVREPEPLHSDDGSDFLLSPDASFSCYHSSPSSTVMDPGCVPGPYLLCLSARFLSGFPQHTLSWLLSGCPGYFPVFSAGSHSPPVSHWGGHSSGLSPFLSFVCMGLFLLLHEQCLHDYLQP